MPLRVKYIRFIVKNKADTCDAFVLIKCLLTASTAQ